jgi:amino acid permease
MGGLPSSGGAGPRSAWARDATIFFTTIAVLLGTGILGLPIKLVDTGFAPFVVIFTVTLGMQLAIVWVHADTLQRAQRHVAARIALEKGAAADLPPGARLPQVDLHTMGRLYLTRPASLLFDAAVLLTFISTLISYSLAGANAFSQLLGVPVDGLIVPFVGACTFLIVFASGVIAPVVSVLTFIKVLLLTFIIGTCGVVAARVGVPFHSSWADVMSPFLVGTVAIGGIGDMMPVFFTYRSPTASDVAHFRWAIAAGILVCYALNVVWARAVLGIVPQTAADAAAEGVPVSLQAAGDAGDIATAPVIQVINSSYPQYKWVASTVTAFITLSITVSFNAVGLGIKHVLDGMAVTALRAASGLLRLSARDLAALEEMGAGGGDPHGGSSGDDDEDVDGEDGGADPATKKKAAARSVGDAAAACAAALNPLSWAASARSACASRGVRLLLTARGAAYAVTFGSILGVALADPSGFISVLEIATSSALNMAGGVFVVLMYVGVRAPPRGSLMAAARAAVAADDAAAAAGGSSSSSGSYASAPPASALFAGKAGAPKGDDDGSVPLLLDGGSGGHAAAGGSHGAPVDESSPGRVALRATAGAVDPGIPSPLHEGLGAGLSAFCLATFAAAVLYDVYNAGVSKGAYGPGTGAWIAVGAGALLWRFVGRPTGALLAAMCKGAAGRSSGAAGEEETGDGDGTTAGVLAALLAPGVTDAVADTALALAVAWGNALAAPAGAAAAAGPAIAAGIALGVHAVAPLPSSGAARLALASDALSAAAAVAVAGLEGAAGHAGPAAVAGVVAALAAAAAAGRACGAADGRRRR